MTSDQIILPEIERVLAVLLNLTQQMANQPEFTPEVINLINQTISVICTTNQITPQMLGALEFKIKSYLAPPELFPLLALNVLSTIPNLLQTTSN